MRRLILFILWFYLRPVPRRIRLAGIRWSVVALVIGWNELAKQQQTIGQKAVCRCMRKLAQDLALEANIMDVPMFGNPIVFTIPIGAALPELEFRESDIELMRRAVAEHDSKSQVAP